jgi:chitinase
MSVIVLLLPFLTRLTVYQHVFAMLSIGGWTGSRFFSSAVATEANRTAFAKAVMAAVSQYNLDGVEFE